MKTLLLLSLVSLGGCALGGLDGGGDDTATSPDVGSTQYVDIFNFAKIDQGAWADARSGLNGRFAATGAAEVPLTFGCSVTSKAGDVSDCEWTFARGAIGVDGKTAQVATDAPTYTCKIAMKTTAVKLQAFLSNDADPLNDALPGGTASIASQLPTCFAHPNGDTPITLGAGTTYELASQYYTSASGKAKWAATQAALVNSFNNICGDSWCSGDFSDLSSLDLDCAVTKSTGNVKTCEWVFGGSFYTVDSKNVSETVQTFSCPVAFHGTVSQLIDLMTPPVSMTDPEDAIHRTLPGGSVAVYDELLNCLP
jgi:hypothetical protein|nr:hypothetical protein [Kofleriaceae bacterium]